jgi:hypothetical protein
MCRVSFGDRGDHVGPTKAKTMTDDEMITEILEAPDQVIARAAPNRLSRGPRRK